MTPPDFERARQYALERLERELAASLTYHSLAHTRDEVVPATERLAAMEGVTGEPLLLLRTAAYFHDLGFVERRNGHEVASAQIAEQVLPGFGYSLAQIQAIRGMILATEIDRAPTTHLEQILADADLDVLGREEYAPRSQDLRDELAALGHTVPDLEWYEGQRLLLETHQYLTASARALRDAGKQRNLERLRALLDGNQSRQEPPHGGVTMSLQVKPAGSDDVGAITRLIRELATAYGEESSITEGYAAEYLSSPGSHALLAGREGQIVGLLSYTIRPNLYHAGSTALIEELVVQTSERGHGVGSALLSELLSELARLGVVEVSVSTMPDNQRARRFYQAHGLVDEAIFLERHL